MNHMTQMTPLSAQPQVFLDEALIAGSSNVRRHLHQPVKEAANPLLVQEHPWERQAVQCYGNVLWDTSARRFRFWYFAAEQRDPDDVPWLVKDGDMPDRPKRLYKTCYAESLDGVQWAKPMVNALDTPLYGDHNILIEDIHSVCVLHEPDDPDPSRRYKAAGGKTTALSEDGLHWRTQVWDAVGKNDTGTSLVKWQGRYLAYVRQQDAHPPDWPLVRAVGLTESEDFATWTPKRTVLQVDEADGFPWTQPYGLTVFPLGDVLVGLLWMIVLDRVDEVEHAWKWNNRVGDIRAELVVSRDGEKWRRVADRAPFLEPEPGTWERARVYPGTSVLEHDDQLWFYYSGTARRHGEGAGASGIGLARLPAERLVSLSRDSSRSAGIVETVELALPEGDLVVNADLLQGGLAVEVTDAAGRSIDEYDSAACRLEPLDGLRWTVKWGPGGLASLPRHRPVRLRFRLGGARLYSFRVSGPSTCG